MTKTIAALMLPLIVAGCATTNAFVRVRPDYSDLPKAQLEQAALKIERAIARGDREASFADVEGVNLNTEAIVQAIRTRAARAEVLSQRLDSGFLCEKHSGLVYIIRSGAYKRATSSQEKDRDALIVSGENNNRWSLYEGIVEANNYPPGALSAVQAIFHEARVRCLESGQKYENADGELVTK